MKGAGAKQIMAATESRAAPWIHVVAGAVRTAFGIVMAVDAYLKWKPAFAEHYVGYLQNAANGQPAWLGPWFHFWLGLVQPHVAFFVASTRLIETAIAVGLLLGVARRLTYLVGAAFSLLIWATAEGFGGPYTAGATNIGPALIYALLFVSLAVFARLFGRTPYSVDYHLERWLPGWGTIMELAPRGAWDGPAAALSAGQQIPSCSRLPPRCPRCSARAARSRSPSRRPTPRSRSRAG